MNLELILNVLRELSDTDYQSALLTGQSEGEQSSFTEAVCVLFNDAGLERAMDSGLLEKTYSRDLCLRAAKLSTLVDGIDDSGAPELTLNHPKMNAIREVASELNELFLAESHSLNPDSPLSNT